MSFDLVTPRSLRDAAALLDPEDPAVRVMSGGTALMLMMKAEVFAPARLISLRRIEPAGFALTPLPDGGWRLGGMATFTQLEHDAGLAGFAPVIARTMRHVANVRVRNVATVGGALAHGDPHMDLPPVLIALDAVVIAISPRGERAIPVADLHTGYYETVLEGDELIREVILPPRPGRRAHYLKCTTRAAKDWPALGVAVSAVLTGGEARDVRLVIGAVGERPLRVAEAEAQLEGREMTPDVIAAAAEAAADTVETIGDELGSAAYKTRLIRVHVERALRALIGPEGAR